MNDVLENEMTKRATLATALESANVDVEAEVEALAQESAEALEIHGEGVPAFNADSVVVETEGLKIEFKPISRGSMQIDLTRDTPMVSNVLETLARGIVRRMAFTMYTILNTIVGTNTIGESREPELMSLFEKDEEGGFQLKAEWADGLGETQVETVVRNFAQFDASLGTVLGIHQEWQRIYANNRRLRDAGPSYWLATPGAQFSSGNQGGTTTRDVGEALKNQYNCLRQVVAARGTGERHAAPDTSGQSVEQLKTSFRI